MSKNGIYIPNITLCGDKLSFEYVVDEKLQVQLEAVKNRMKQHTASGDAYLNGSLDYLMATGGKMLRPMLLLIGSKAGRLNYRREDGLIKLATAIEIIHMATLIHDDIIDQSNLRRGSLSIQAKYGQSYAVYMGDYLLSQCFLLLTHLELEKELAVDLAKVVTRICVGDMKQHQNRYNLNMTPLKYIRMVSGKTAALISVALSSGAYFAKAKEKDVKLLGRIGYELGMAFQLMDDILDFEGDEELVGKELRVDVLRGYYSMPVIFSLQEKNENSSKLRTLLSQDMSEDDLSSVMSIVKESGGLKMTKDLAIRYNDRAMALIEQLPKGYTKEQLEKLVPYLLHRVM